MNRQKTLFAMLRANPVKKEVTQSKQKLLWNIYHPWGEKGEQAHRFRMMIFFKKKIIGLALTLLDFAYGKELKKAVPSQAAHDEDLRAFNVAFENAIYTWSTEYVANQERNQSKDPKTFSDGYTTQGSAATLRTAKRLLLYIALNDTAYREFLNILNHKIAKEITRIHGVHKTHVFYTSNSIFDADYAYVYKKVKDYKSVGDEFVVKRTRSN